MPAYVRISHQRATSSPFESAGMAKDEAYVIDICDRVLGRKALRRHRFPFLLGDSGRPLPVDAYYPDLRLVVEYRERQHTETVTLWDRKPTVSGIPRREQRALYDQRRRDVLTENGITLVELNYTDFKFGRRKRLLRSPEDDERVVREKLSRWIEAMNSMTGESGTRIR